MCLIKSVFVGEKNFERYQNARYNNKNTIHVHFDITHFPCNYITFTKMFNTNSLHSTCLLLSATCFGLTLWPISEAETCEKTLIIKKVLCNKLVLNFCKQFTVCAQRGGFTVTRPSKSCSTAHTQQPK